MNQEVSLLILGLEPIRRICNVCRKGFQEMLRIQTGRHELCFILDHHEENLFAVFVYARNLVKINNTALS
jgi:hypothetical protein